MSGSHILHIVFCKYIFFVNGHFTSMNLKLRIKGSKKMKVHVGTIVDLPFLRVKMAYCRKSLSCRLRNLKKAIILQELGLRSIQVTL